MELRHLKYFVAVAEERTFVHAAERLHISQPPLSTQVKELEVELGVTLLKRSPRGVELTAAGKVFYAEALAILARAEHSKIAARRAADGEEGTLAVGFVSIADYSVLPPALRAFRDRFPAVDVQLHELTTDAQVIEMLAGRLDVGIALAPIDEAQLRFAPLHAEKLILAVPSDHRQASAQAPVDLKLFAREPFVLVPRPLAPGLHDTMLACCRERGFVPDVVQYAKQMQTVISLVAGGFGLALVPESVRTFSRTGVTYLSIHPASPDVQVGVIHRKGDDNPIVRSFLECTLAVSVSPVAAR